MFYCVFDAVVDEDDDEASPEIMNNPSRSVPMETEDEHVTMDTSRSNNSNTAVYHRRQGHESRDSNRATNQPSLRPGRSEELNGIEDGRTGSRATGIRRWFSWFNTSNKKSKTGDEIPSHEVQGEASSSRQRASSSSDQEIFHTPSSFRSVRRGLQASRDEQNYDAQYPWYLDTATMTHENTMGVQEESRPILSDHLISQGCSTSFVDQRSYDTGHERTLSGSLDVPCVLEKQNTEESYYEVRSSNRNVVQDAMEVYEDAPSFLNSSSSNISPFISASKTSISKANDISTPPSINADFSCSTVTPEDTIDNDDNECRREEVPGGTIPDIYALIVRTLNLSMTIPTNNEAKTCLQPPSRKYSEDMNIEDAFTSRVPEHSTPTLHRIHTEWPQDHVNIEVLIGLKEPKNSFEALAVQEFMAKENLASIDVDAMSVYQHSSFSKVTVSDRVDSGVGSRGGFKSSK